ncbi:VOC family protein [Alkaliphilus oremlandii]|uniref:Glyoxalase/bleomycin resistance protein/dioxygenase n=1 Tax=Alkaliphilus oremlandii (strain OhILAs) TaxID=350688 RepID=A8MKD6_ALKOO|nr:VOC family protein [Alkaliphilus oremlandii]ABW20268.1 Glyoxalase/bleomycin resistance protein/dioxygenase [Alkaliphilus oremlandii OhILAs]
MKIGFVAIHVKDLDESLVFYTELLGFTEIKRFSPEEGVHLVFLKDEEAGKLELVYNQNVSKSPKDSKGSKVTVGLEVQNLEAVLRKLKSKGVEPIRGPIAVPSGEKIAFIEDPNGVEIEFIEGF